MAKISTWAKLIYIEYFKGVYNNTIDNMVLSGEATDEDVEKFYDALNVYRVPWSLKSTIDECMKNYPDLYPSREFVLEHLYCTVGNGFEWLKGALVEDFPGLRDIERERDRKLLKRLEELKNDLIQQGIEPYKDLPRQMKIYPLSDRYSRICAIPKDIKSDYLDGAIETIDLINRYGTKKDIALAKKVEQKIIKKIGNEEYDKRCLRILHT